jgi:type II secretory pathway pseudopilin PulG
VTTRDRTILAVIALVAAVVAPWVLVVSPKQSEASKIEQQITAAQSQLTALRAETASGQLARRSFIGSYTDLVRLGEAVPTDDNTPSLIYQLQAAADAAHVSFDTLTFNAGQGGSSTASSSTASQAAAAVLPPGATIGPAGFPIEPFTFTFQGDFFHLADFLGRLQRFVTVSNRGLAVSGRLMTLNAISLGPAPAGFPRITATISATTFLLPAAQGLVNGATPAGPASSTQTVSTPTQSSSPPPAVAATPVR